MKATIAFLGNAGWYEQGVAGRTANSVTTFSRTVPGGLRESELTAPLRVDLRPTFRENPLGVVLSRPGLHLELPPGNVRNLFEGCIGNEGTTDGHPWDGELESLSSSDSVGLDVYLAVLKAQGAIIVQG